MSLTPFFSVVIPLFNKEKYIKATLDSVLKQTYANFEVIIINDGSSDNSIEVINEFDDERIKISSQENQGLSASRNKGIKIAIAEYIAFLDADDLWKEDYLEVMHQLIINNTKHNIFACSAAYCDRKEG